MSKKVWMAVLFGLLPCLTFAANTEKMPIHGIVVFGDSMSDGGNLTHLLKSIKQQEDPAYLTNPMKHFVFRKMDDFAAEYYVPFSVLMAGKKLVQEFFDIQLAPALANLLLSIKDLPIFPEDPYWNHHFSNGRTWNEDLALNLGINLKDEDEYVNYAFGGSWAASYDHQLTTWNLIRHPIWSLQNLIAGKLIPPSLGLEVAGYLIDNEHASPDKMFLIFAGGNDYLNMLYFEDNYNPKYMSEYVDYIVGGVVYAVDKLAASGGKHFTILGVPNIGLTPWYNRTMDAEILEKASRWHNERLAQEIERLRESYPNANFTFVNVMEVFEGLMSKAKDYGITNTTDACVDIALPSYAFTKLAPEGKVFRRNVLLEYIQYAKVGDGHGGFRNNAHQCSDPKTHAFWDLLHPTATVHKALGNEVCNALASSGYQASCEKSLL
jgi:phospholipase/lecithinase/hemolysin